MPRKPNQQQLHVQNIRISWRINISSLPGTDDPTLSLPDVHNGRLDKNLMPRNLLSSVSQTLMQACQAVKTTQQPSTRIHVQSREQLRQPLRLQDSQFPLGWSSQPFLGSSASQPQSAGHCFGHTWRRAGPLPAASRSRLAQSERKHRVRATSTKHRLVDNG